MGQRAREQEPTKISMTPPMLLVEIDDSPKIDTLWPNTPGPPPSPIIEEEEADRVPDYVPVPPPPRESVSVPASFRRSKFHVERGSSSLPTSALPSRNGSARPRRLPALKRNPEEVTLGQFGPGMYDVSCSKTGSPLKVAKGIRRFGTGERFDREKCYEGKARSTTLLGQFGPGMYDVSCSKTGSPLKVAKGARRFGTG